MQANVFSMTGRVVVVTGAGQGVGEAIARTMAGQGAKAVVFNDYFLDRAEAAAESCRKAGFEALAIQSDVTDRSQVKSMFDQVVKKYGDVHVLVNNAGNAGPGIVSVDLPKFWETTAEDWQKWMSTNLTGVMNCSYVVCPLLMKHQQGRIITIVSDAGRVGEIGYAVYSAAKAGAAGLMRALAKEMGRYMTTVNCISLASIDTPALAARNADPEYVKRKLAKYVIRRQGQPGDVAGAAAFLASDAGSWITGQTIGVNGGYSFN